MQPDPYVPGPAGEVVAPYIEDGVFVRDFWQDDRVGAMKGALAEVYEEVNLMLGGPTGAAAARGADNFVVMPGPFERWNEATTSPGTPASHGGPGWIAAGATYRYDYHEDHAYNAAVWTECGCPKANDFGQWANGGLPLGYVQFTWENPDTRGEWPLRRRGGGRRR